MKKKLTQNKRGRVRLQDCEWKFDALPDDELELEACCRWEYARESQFIRDVTKLKAEMRDGKFPTLAEQKHLERLEKICESPFLSPDHFFKCPPFPQPWLSLDKTIRPAPKMDASRKKWMEWQSWNESRRPFLSSKIPPVEYAFQAIDSRLPWSRFQRPNPGGRVVSRNGVETLLVEINWGKCTDNQIIESFERWIKNKHRPTGIGVANTKGKRVEIRWQVMLDNLAIMRLLSRATFNKMEEKFPDAWKRYKSADWYRARQNANRNFHELFPFLTAKEFPLSWSR
jgi:hypothetical protein